MTGHPLAANREHRPVSGTGRSLADLSAEESAARVGPGSIILLPIGAVEQHGPHLPLSTDLILVDAFADEVVRRHGDVLDLWRLPTLPFSKSNEHAWAPGTLWLGPETLLAVLRDLGRSLQTLASRKLVFLNGHGGNTSLLDVACRELRLEHGLETFLVHPVLPADHGGAGDPAERGLGIHGGVDETSLLLHLRPELVDMSRAVADLPVFLDGFEHLRFGGSASFGWSSDDLSGCGVIGDPTMASAVHGERAFEAGVEHLAEVLDEIRRFRFPVMEVADAGR